MSSCNACNHSAIENSHILSHGSNDFDNKFEEALYMKNQTPLLVTCTNMVHHFIQCILIIIKLIFNCNMTYNHVL